MTEYNYGILTNIGIRNTNEKEIFASEKDAEICNEIMETLNFFSPKSGWKRDKNLFFFEDIDAALKMKFHFYDYIKSAGFLDKKGKITTKRR